MNKTYIMLKDKPVLAIENYACKILDYEMLPISLRYKGVSFDDVMHGWTEIRTMNIGKTNAKKILSGFKLRQSNPYTIAKLFHFASLTDCYWMKEENEAVKWKDISLFSNSLDKAVSASALLGVNTTFPPMSGKIHTPELTAQGVAAKAWIREEDGLYLYKIGKKELAASQILDVLDIAHVNYVKADDSRLSEFADLSRVEKIREGNEEIVKCKILTSEDISIVSWEDFQLYCAYHEINEFDYIKKNDGASYYSMQIADYIMGNDDRHGANFGFFMNNETGALLPLYPLLDHDHAFSNDREIPSQCSETEETLKAAAINALNYAAMDFTKLSGMDKPETITQEQWNGVIERKDELLKEARRK